MEYFAIIGDIKASKTISNRNEIQEKLRAVLDTINRRYSGDIAAKFLITLGDEFQGLLVETNKLFEIIKLIQREMYPIEVRIGIGKGIITTKIDKKAAIGTDGPAFYAARKAIEDIREAEKKYKKQAPDIQMGMYKCEKFEILEINMLLALIKAIEDGWSEKQRYTIWDMMVNKGSQEICAMRMGTSQSTVARRLADGKYNTYVNALKITEGVLCKLEEKSDN